MFNETPIRGGTINVLRSNILLCFALHCVAYKVNFFCQLTRITIQLSEHDKILRILRQERISSEANIDQIFRSSNNLEQLLRATVTDLNQLKRDFEASADVRNVVPRLQRT